MSPVPELLLPEDDLDQLLLKGTAWKITAIPQENVPVTDTRIKTW